MVGIKTRTLEIDLIKPFLVLLLTDVVNMAAYVHHQSESSVES